MNIHHIGYLVKKGPKAQAAFEALGYIAEGEWTHDEIRKVDILFLQKDGYRIELVSPYAPDSVVSGLIKTYKNAPYHLCYEAENFEKELADYREAAAEKAAKTAEKKRLAEEKEKAKAEKAKARKEERLAALSPEDRLKKEQKEARRAEAEEAAWLRELAAGEAYRAKVKAELEAKGV